jgi:hypothetical protein
MLAWILVPNPGGWYIPPPPTKIQCPYCKTPLKIKTPSENKPDTIILDIPVILIGVWIYFNIDGMTVLEVLAAFFILVSAAIFTDYIEYKYYEVLTLIPPPKK